MESTEGGERDARELRDAVACAPYDIWAGKTALGGCARISLETRADHLQVQNLGRNQESSRITPRLQGRDGIPAAALFCAHSL